MFDISYIAAKIATSTALQARDSQAIRDAQLDLDNARITKSAQDFESILLGHWLEQAEQSFATVPGTDEEEAEDTDPGHDALQGIGMQSLAGAITASGGIGLAGMISRQLKRASHNDGGGSPMTQKGQIGQGDR